MIYDIRHVTTYSYESPVSFARCSLRLEPRNGDGQQLISHNVEIKPGPLERTLRTDFFGIHTENIVIETAHRVLRIDARSRVDVSRTAPARDMASPDWEQVREAAFASNGLMASSPVGYLFASPLVPIVSSITDYAMESFPSGAGIFASAASLMRRINRDFAYDTKATEILTPLQDVFDKRRGVCQDFAHVMIAGLRASDCRRRMSAAICAPRRLPGKPRLQGADATHAWVSVWCGDEIAGRDLIPPTIW